MESDLFNQVLAIAMKEGKLQFSKDADPSQSGIVGENFLLFSRQRKLLISIPLENLKRNKQNTNSEQQTKWINGCFILAYPVFCIIGVLIIGNPHEDPYGMWAMRRVITCDSDFQGWGRRDFQEKYQIIPKSIDGRCPPDVEVVKAISSDLSRYPTFIYNRKTGEKTCFHNGDEERHYHGCTAKKNGTWFEITNW